MDCPETLLIAAPRGFCAGVERAVRAVEEALERYGPPIYVRRQIVHNRHVVERLRQMGAVFVDDEAEAPHGARIVFSAHGVAPAVHHAAADRELDVIDATCPLVTKVHVEARRFAAAGRTVVLIGHAGHDEVVGITGEAPDSIVLVQTVEDVDRLEVEDPDNVAFVVQTTLSVYETGAIVERLRRRFPRIVGPRTDDICYATTNRQAAVKELARRCQAILVIGSANSSNTLRLVETARRCGARAERIDDERDIREQWLAGASRVGLTSGASVPEELVERVVAWFRDRGTKAVGQVRIAQEEVRFMLPRALRDVRPSHAGSAG